MESPPLTAQPARLSRSSSRPATRRAGCPEGLAALCAKAAALPLSVAILVVDSASTDATADVVRRWPAGPVPVGLLRCDRPGKGLAVRAGLLATRAPFVGFCDADMATDLSALDVAIRLLVAGHQVVIGSRGLRESVVQSRSSLARRAGAFVFRSVAASIVPGSTDTQCGFKFFAGPLARIAAGSLRTRRVRLRRGTARSLPAAGGDGHRDPGSVAGRHRLHVLGQPSLGRRVPRPRVLWLQSLAQGEVPTMDAPPASYAGWAMPVTPLPSSSAMARPHEA